MSILTSRILYYTAYRRSTSSRIGYKNATDTCEEDSHVFLRILFLCDRTLSLNDNPQETARSEASCFSRGFGSSTCRRSVDSPLNPMV